MRRLLRMRRSGQRGIGVSRGLVLGCRGERRAAVAREPGGADLHGRHAAGQHDLEGALAKLQRGWFAVTGEFGVYQAVGRIVPPVELLLRRDHLAEQASRGRAVRVELGTG